MTGTPPKGNRENRVDHRRCYNWGEFKVSVGAAALFGLRPLQAGQVAQPFPRARIEHPPLTMLLATSQELQMPDVEGGIVSYGASTPDGSVWMLTMWATKPPAISEPEELGFISAHNIAALARDTVVLHLPDLLLRGSVSPGDAILYAQDMGRIASIDIHGAYCHDPHPWPPRPNA